LTFLRQIKTILKGGDIVASAAQKKPYNRDMTGSTHENPVQLRQMDFSVTESMSLSVPRSRASSGICAMSAAGGGSRNPVNATQDRQSLPSRGGLVPWKAQLIESFVDESLGETVQVQEMAALTRLRTNYFYKAFRSNFGNSPHAYLMKHRAARTQGTPMQIANSLSQIALGSGLTDQVHLSLLFAREVGVCPARRRRGQWSRHASCQWRFGTPYSALKVSPFSFLGSFNKPVVTYRSL
jgi:AraC family transcriptional regulator